MITDLRWLRMDALFSLGTSTSYKKEVIADNLEGYINSRMCICVFDMSSPS